MKRGVEEGLFLLGRPLSPLYSSIMRLRRWLFDRGVFPSYDVGIPVVSVGNLLLGGTGKTPLVEEIVKWSLKKGVVPAVLSRGYKGKVGKGPKILLAHGRIEMGPFDAGDEPYMLAWRLKQWGDRHGIECQPIIIVGSNRVRAAQMARERGAEVIILDDGFQHLHLRRDLDIVLFPYDIRLESLEVFPGGRLREPLDVAKLADIIIISKCPSKISPKDIEYFSNRFSEKEVLFMHYQPEGLTPLHGEAIHSLGGLRGKRVVAFCGIGDPGSFQSMIQGLGCDLVGFKEFGDHHKYHGMDLFQLKSWQKALKADIILTTEKDMVKIKRVITDGGTGMDHAIHTWKLYAVRLGLEVDQRLYSILDKISAR